MHLKKLILFLLLTLIAISPLLAAEKDHVANELERLNEKLSLNETQISQVEQILQENHKQAMADRKANKGDREAMQAANQKRDDLKNKQIAALLNGDQKVVFDDMIAFRASLDPRTRGLVDYVGLDDTQAEQVADILATSREEMEEMRYNMDGDRRKMREVFRKHREETDEKIVALLTDDQQKLYQEYQEQLRERRGREGRGNRGGERGRLRGF